MRPMLWLRNMHFGSPYEPSEKMVRGVWIGLGVLSGAVLIFAGVLFFVHL